MSSGGTCRRTATRGGSHRRRAESHRRRERRGARPPLRLPPVHAARPARALGRAGDRRGQGRALRDIRGRTYLDAMAGLWCVNVGYGRREIAEALHDAGRCGSATTTRSRRWRPTCRRELAERVIGAVPRADVEGLLRQQRLGRERHPGQARLVLQQRPRPAREEEDHLARPRLPRRHRRCPPGSPGCRACTTASTCRCR